MIALSMLFCWDCLHAFPVLKETKYSRYGEDGEMVRAECPICGFEADGKDSKAALQRWLDEDRKRRIDWMRQCFHSILKSGATPQVAMERSRDCGSVDFMGQMVQDQRGVF